MAQRISISRQQRSRERSRERAQRNAETRSAAEQPDVTGQQSPVDRILDNTIGRMNKTINELNRIYGMYENVRNLPSTINAFRIASDAGTSASQAHDEFITNKSKYETVEAIQEVLVPRVEEFESATTQFRLACELLIPILVKYEKYNDLLTYFFQYRNDRDMDKEKELKKLLSKLYYVVWVLISQLISPNPIRPDLNIWEAEIQELRDRVTHVEGAPSDRPTGHG